MSTTPKIFSWITPFWAVVLVMGVIILSPFILIRLFLPLIWWAGLVYFGMNDNILGAVLWCAGIMALVWFDDLMNKTPDSIAEAREMVMNGMEVAAWSYAVEHKANLIKIPPQKEAGIEVRQP